MKIFSRVSQFIYATLVFCYLKGANTMVSFLSRDKGKIGTVVFILLIFTVIFLFIR